MSLSSALSIAQQSIRATARQTSIVSRNVQEAGNPDYNRRVAVLTSNAPGVAAGDVQRAVNEQLFRQNLAATSAYSGQSALAAGLDQLALAVNGSDNANSPATALGRLQQSLQLYATTPSNRALAESTLDAARDVVRSLNDGAAAIASFRTDTDGQIATAVNELNALLGAFKDANDAVTVGTRTGKDVLDALDRRDGLLKKIADYVPVTAITRGDNDMVLVTGDGATLFERLPRAVSFTPTSPLAAGTTGSPVTIDGVPVRAGQGGNAGSAGKIAGLTQLRDGFAPTLQSQLDEIARGVISAFAETDPSATPSLPDRAGLFTWGGGPSLPPAGLVTGLAGSLRLNPAIDTAQGGNVLLLRDGGANGAGYSANPAGNASYSARLLAYGGRMDAAMSFDGAAGLGTGQSLANFSAQSIGWIEAGRKEAASSSESKQALAARTAEALSNDTGVNVDQEMSLLLDLEQSYQASARLIKAVDDMLSALLAAVR